MTDNEIIKALEDLLELMLHEGDLQRTSIISKALDLIKRKDAEIERLQKTVVDLNANLSESINRFTRMETLYKIKCKELEITKSEAIKEFAERLKNCFAISGDYLDIINIIDNILKEMTEVETNQRKEDEGK